ncbi:AAA family ATPase [Rhodoferax sp.]|jgi:adenylate kinase family enzyme|uniref:AAA family ATPase n=1 Tax=Rhodoferax sp. TaxID=50421 RepID=UPI003783E8BC
MRVLITGAAGSGTSTLGEALAQQWNARFLEADSYFWLPTQPPFTQKRLPEERSTLLMQALESERLSVVAGSVMGWGTQVEDAFGLVIFLYVPTEVRLQRLESREVQRYGKANKAFLEWAEQYDEGLQKGRSLAKHKTWLTTRACQVIRLVGNYSVTELLTQIEQQAPNPSSGTARFVK